MCSRRPRNCKTGHFTSWKNENVFKMSKDEKCTCKACKNTVFHCRICKFVEFLLPSSSWLLKAPSTRIRIFLNPQLFLSGYENIRVHTLCDHSVFISNSPVHTYSDSLRINKIVPPDTGSSSSNPESSSTALLSYSFKLFLPAVLSGR